MPSHFRSLNNKYHKPRRPYDLGRVGNLLAVALSMHGEEQVRYETLPEVLLSAISKLIDASGTVSGAAWVLAVADADESDELQKHLPTGPNQRWSRRHVQTALQQIFGSDADKVGDRLSKIQSSKERWRLLIRATREAPNEVLAILKSHGQVPPADARCSTCGANQGLAPVHLVKASGGDWSHGYVISAWTCEACCGCVDGYLESVKLASGKAPA